MPERRRNIENVLAEAWQLIDGDAANLHHQLDDTDLATISWEPIGTAKLASWPKENSDDKEAVIFSVVGRILDDKVYGFDAKFGFGGGYDFEGHKARVNIGIPRSGDSCDSFNPANSWQSVLQNIREVIDRVPVDPETTARSSVIDEAGGNIGIRHRVWQKRNAATTVFSDDDPVDWKKALLAPINAARYPCFERTTFPFPKPSKTYDAVHTVSGDLNITPLPAFDWDNHRPMMPEEYEKFKGALVLVHFVLEYNVVKKKEYFTATVRRIDLLESAQQLVPESPRKKRRIGGSSTGGRTTRSGGGSSATTAKPNSVATAH